MQHLLWNGCIVLMIPCQHGSWINKYTCPGFIFHPRKPWPFGNKYHTIEGALSGILYDLEIVKEKDQPQEMRSGFNEMGTTSGLLVCLTNKLWRTGKIVVLDSGFCILQGLVELKKRGVFASALIKMRRYWTQYVDCKSIKAHFIDKGVGAVDAMHGSLDRVKVFIFAMKEPDYVMSLMSTYGTNEQMGEEIFQSLHAARRLTKVSFK